MTLFSGGRCNMMMREVSNNATVSAEVVHHAAWGWCACRSWDDPQKGISEVAWVCLPFLSVSVSFATAFRRVIRWLRLATRYGETIHTGGESCRLSLLSLVARRGAATGLVQQAARPIFRDMVVRDHQPGKKTIMEKQKSTKKS